MTDASGPIDVNLSSVPQYVDHGLMSTGSTYDDEVGNAWPLSVVPID